MLKKLDLCTQFVKRGLATNSTPNPWRYLGVLEISYHDDLAYGVNSTRILESCNMVRRSSLNLQDECLVEVYKLDCYNETMKMEIEDDRELINAMVLVICFSIFSGP